MGSSVSNPILGSAGFLLNYEAGHPTAVAAARQTYLQMLQELTIRNEKDPWRVDRIVF